MRKKQEDRVELFATVRRGFDPEQVDEHLATLEAEHLATLDEVRREHQELRSELEAARDREEAVHLTLLAATKTKDEILSAAERTETAAREEASRTVTDARHEAFRLVTEARTSAEQIIAEALREADGLAPPTNGPGTNGSGELAQMEQLRVQFETEHADLVARVSDLRAIASGLEGHIGSIGNKRPDDAIPVEAAPSELEAPVATEEPPQVVEPTSDAKADDALQAVDAESDSIDRAAASPMERKSVDDVAPGHEVVPEPNPAPSEVTVPEPVALEDDAGPLLDRTAAKGSFYSRRSANLPRIGAAAGRSTLAAMSGLRNSMSTPDDAYESAEDEDLAIQSA